MKGNDMKHTPTLDRMVKCYDACEGIPNPAGVPDVVEAARAMVREYGRGEDVISAVRALSAALDKLEDVQ